MPNTVIASRTFSLVDEKDKNIVIEVYEPNRSDRSGSWECRVLISAASGRLDEIGAGGTDSYQALTLGLSMLQAMVNRYNCDLGFKLRFQEDVDLDLKIPQE